MKALLLLLALSAQPVEFEQAAEVCVLEINHTYDANGIPCLDQLIAWSWDAEQGRHVLREWRLLKRTGDYPRQAGDEWVAPWGPCRQVRARHLRESWRQYDVEVLDQKRTPRDERVPLFREPQPTPAPLPGSQEQSR